MPERRVGECLQRVVERRELSLDPQQLLVRIEPPAEAVHLVAQPVEALEQRIELSVADLLALHPFYLRFTS